MAGVIKTILMMQHKMIPKQANFVTLNPRIKTSSSDRITVPRETLPWIAQRRVALVNNYGAAGSNAAILLCEYPQMDGRGCDEQPSAATSYPILLSAKTVRHLESSLNALKSCLPTTDASIRNIAYNLARRQNFDFEYRVAFAASSTRDLLSALSTSNAAPTRTGKKPVVLAFGGQMGRTVTISRELYNECAILRKNLVRSPT